MKKKIGIGMGLAIFVLLLWWFVFGAGISVVKFFLGIQTHTGGEHLYMTEEQIEKSEQEKSLNDLKETDGENEPPASFGACCPNMSKKIREGQRK